MEVLVLDGKNYVKASKAAKDLGYATDYVGQLCRSGQVDSHLIGRTWYVNQEELSTHRVEKKRMSRVKAREHAKKTIEEYRKQNEDAQNNYTSVDIQYQEDTDPLIPQTKKITVIREKVKRNFTASEEEGDRKEVVNRGKKVLMEGNINVVDVTEGLIDSDTTVLKPKIFAGVQEPIQKRRVVDDIPTTEPELDGIPLKKSFIEKLEDKSVKTSNLSSPTGEDVKNEVTQETVEVVIVEAPKSDTESKRPTISILTCVVIVIAFFTITIATFPLAKNITYTKDQLGTVSVNVGLYFSTEEAKMLMLSKI